MWHSVRARGSSSRADAGFWTLARCCRGGARAPSHLASRRRAGTLRWAFRGPAACPEVTLVEPPCLVVGRPFQKLNIHLSREVRAYEALDVAVTRGGEMMACKTAGNGRKVSVCIPDIDCCAVGVVLLPNGKDRVLSAPGILALPEGVAEEFTELFYRMVEEVKNGDGQANPGSTHGQHELWMEPARKAVKSEAINFETMCRSHGDRQWLEKAVWAKCFRPFCSDFADVLEGLSCGGASLHSLRTSLAAYFISNDMWASASFFLTTCMRHGVTVTAGPFKLTEEELLPRNLKMHFLAASAAFPDPGGGSSGEGGCNSDSTVPASVAEKVTDGSCRGNINVCIGSGIYKGVAGPLVRGNELFSEETGGSCASSLF